MKASRRPAARRCGYGSRSCAKHSRAAPSCSLRVAAGTPAGRAPCAGPVAVRASPGRRGACPRNDPERALQSLTAALDEWRGSPLHDLAYAPWAQAPVVRLEELRAAALELRVEAQLEGGRHARTGGRAAGAGHPHPLRERLWGQLMTRSRRRPACRRARRLSTGAGQARGGDRHRAGAQLQALEARILPQDPDLEGGAAATARPARAVLAVCTDDPSPAALASRLAALSASEVVAVGLVQEVDVVGAATRPLRDVAPGDAWRRSRPAIRSEDTVRLAAEQDAPLLLVSLAPDGSLDDAMLRGAACDVALVAGGALGRVRCSAVLRPRHRLGGDGGGPLARSRYGHAARRPRGRDRQRHQPHALQRLARVPARPRGPGGHPRLVAGGAGGVLEVPAGAIVVGLWDRWPARFGRGAPSACARGALPRAPRPPRHPASRPRPARGAHALQLVRRWLITAPTTGPRLSRTGCCS